MKQKNISFIPLFLLLVATTLASGCEDAFEKEYLPGGQLEKEGRIIINSVLEAGQETIRIESGIAIPIRGNRKTETASLKMQLKVNGETVEIMEEKDSTGGYIGQKNFLTAYCLQPGDVVEIEARSDAVQPARSQISLPPELPEMKVTQQEVYTDKSRMYNYDETQNNHCLQFSIELDEVPQKGDYYGVQVRKKRELIGYDAEKHQNVYINPHRYDHYVADGLYVYSGSDRPFAGRKKDICGYFHDSEIQLFDGKQVCNGKTELDVLVKYEPRCQLLVDDPDLYERICYQLVVSRVTPEFYHTIEKYNVAEGIWALGIGPHAFVYSNIAGGVGMLSAKTDYISNWICNENEK